MRPAVLEGGVTADRVAEEDAGDDEPCWLRRSRRSTVARRRRRALHSRVSLAIDSTGEIGWSDR